MSTTTSEQYDEEGRRGTTSQSINVETAVDDVVRVPDRAYNRDIYVPLEWSSERPLSDLEFRHATKPARLQFFEWDCEAQRLKARHQMQAMWIMRVVVFFVVLSLVWPVAIAIALIGAIYSFFRKKTKEKEAWISMRINAEIVRAFLGISLARRMVEAIGQEPQNIEREWVDLRRALQDGDQRKLRLRDDRSVFDDVLGINALKNAIESFRTSDFVAIPSNEKLAEFDRLAEIYLDLRPGVQLDYFTKNLSLDSAAVAIRGARWQGMALVGLSLAVLSGALSQLFILNFILDQVTRSMDRATLSVLLLATSSVFLKLGTLLIALSSQVRGWIGSSGLKATYYRNRDFGVEWLDVRARIRQTLQRVPGPNRVAAILETSLEAEELGLMEHQRFVKDSDATEHVP